MRTTLIALAVAAFLTTGPAAGAPAIPPNGERS